MPRNGSGVYTLPAGNPVVPDTLIDADWANPTMADLGQEITNSLPRAGTAPMTGPLFLAGNAVQPLEAVPKQQMDALLGGSTSYIPAGAIQYFATAAVPAGWLVADGSEKSRTTYSDLFTAIGTLYGGGNGATTFNLPDLRGTFLRSLDSGRGIDPGRGIGTFQGGTNQYHTHGTTDNGHNHAFDIAPHSHSITDPGHNHTMPGFWTNQPGNDVGTSAVQANSDVGDHTNSAFTGINATNPAVFDYVIHPATTGLAINYEGVEARPVNVAMVACIRAYGAVMTGQLGTMAFQDANAVNITGGSGVFSHLECTAPPIHPNDVVRLQELGGLGAITAILSGDPQALFVDNTTPLTPIIRPVVNQPNGLLKLNAAGIVPPNLINPSGFNYEGTWDASGGTLPPTVGVQDGSFYDVVVAGTLTVYMPDGNPQVIAVAIGSRLVWLATSASLPVNHWYYEPPPALSGATASQVTNVPSGGISASNVQDALNELDSEKFDKVGGHISGDVTLDGSFLIVAPEGFGYAFGAGEAVNQAATSGKSTDVVITRPNGTITMDPALLNSNTTASFQVSGGTLAVGDTFLVSVCWGPVDPLNYIVWAGVNTGSPVARVSLLNRSPTNLSEAVILKYAVIKGSLS